MRLRTRSFLVHSIGQCNTICSNVDLEVFYGQLGCPGLSAGQKTELWRRWKNGQSLSDIGRALGKHAGSIHGVISSNGGIAPAARCRSRLALSLAEREEIISRSMAVSASMRQIAS